MSTILSPPSGDLTSSGSWTIFPADGVYWNKLLSDDGDTTYITGESSNCEVLFLHSGISVPSEANQIILRARLVSKVVSGGAASVKQALRINGVTYLGAAHGVSSTSYPTYSLTGMFNWAFVGGKIQSVNPGTGLPFTPDEVNGIGIYAIDLMGLNCPDASPHLRFTKYDFHIYYAVPPPVGVAYSQAHIIG